MGMMERMMNGMVTAMPAEEREEIMLKLFPQMMSEVDMARMMPEMLKVMGRLLSLYSIYAFLAAVLGDDEAKERFGDILSQAKASMPQMMEMMHPVMAQFMPSVMPKMMSIMAPMMPLMAKEMPTIMESVMVPTLREKPEMRDQMLSMMQTMFPQCARSMFPMIETGKRAEFVGELTEIMNRVIEPATEE